MEEWNFITKEDCEEILKNYTTCGKYISFSIRSLLEEVEGFLSSHFSLDITYLDEEENEEKTNTFFVKKHANEAGFLSELAESLRVFEKESFIYRLCKEYATTLKYFENFAPECYLQKDACIVIEDLTKVGYKLVDKSIKSLNPEECKAGLKTIAQYHAYSISYEEIKTKELKDDYRLDEVHPEYLQRSFLNGTSENNAASEFIRTTIETLINLVDVIPEDKCNNKQEFKDLILKEADDKELTMSLQKKYRHCCIHGDLWSKNLMFNEQNRCLLIDFQLLRYYLPAYDVIMFLYYNTTIEYRKENKQQLFKYYFDCLTDELTKNDVDCSSIMKFEDLLESSLICAPFAKIQVVNDIALFHLPETLYVEAYQNPDMFRKILIESRTDYFLEALKDNPDFKDILVEQLLDFKSALEEKQLLLNEL